VLDLEKTPLDFMMDMYKDLSREDARKFLGRYGVSGDVQTQVRWGLIGGWGYVYVCRVVGWGGMG
jgi:hypothetical protein